jgi:hypothetical protein
LALSYGNYVRHVDEVVERTFGGPSEFIASLKALIERRQRTLDRDSASAGVSTYHQ